MALARSVHIHLAAGSVVDITDGRIDDNQWFDIQAVAISGEAGSVYWFEALDADTAPGARDLGNKLALGQRSPVLKHKAGRVFYAWAGLGLSGDIILQERQHPNELAPTE